MGAQSGEESKAALAPVCFAGDVDCAAFMIHLSSSGVKSMQLTGGGESGTRGWRSVKTLDKH